MTTTNDSETQPGTSPTPSGPVIVVGVDGSEGSSAALRWAAEEARLRGATLQVVRAWHFPTMGYAGMGYLPVAPVEGLAEATASDMRTQIADALGEHPLVPIDPKVVEGPAAQALLKAAEGAEMLVVGSRGRGGFADLLLGSVSTHVAHHAHCPVLIVRS